jgi:SEC-C motif-containing protein
VSGRCPCGQGELYSECCGIFHRGENNAATAELLMRSRFSAYAVRDAAYLLRTWHATTRPETMDFDTNLSWTRLEILGKTAGGPFHTEGTVEFNAHYRMGDGAEMMHENSSFVREDGIWFYVKAA